MPVSLNDMRFLIHDVLGFEQHYRSLGLSDPPNRELIDAIIDEAVRFTETELAPLNESGDVQGCRMVVPTALAIGGGVALLADDVVAVADSLA